MARHMLQSEGGTYTAAFYSGATVPAVAGAPNAVTVGSDVLLQSGPGRLCTTFFHKLIQSGTGISIYDAPTPVSGGPISASGHIPLAFLPPIGIGATASGSAPLVPQVGYTGWDMPFRQGLCVNSRSGQPGFTLTWSIG